MLRSHLPGREDSATCAPAGSGSDARSERTLAYHQAESSGRCGAQAPAHRYDPNAASPGPSIHHVGAAAARSSCTTSAKRWSRIDGRVVAAASAPRLRATRLGIRSTTGADHGVPKRRSPGAHQRPHTARGAR